MSQNKATSLWAVAPVQAQALASAPLVALVTVMVGLFLWGPSTSHESANLLLVLNILFTTLVSAFIAILTARSFLITGRPALLAICTGMIVWGASALVAAIGANVGNYNLTIHNLGVAASGFCHLTGAIVARRFGERSVADAGAWLSIGVAASLCTVGAIQLSAEHRWLPPFYLEGVGATRLRATVLTIAVGLFAGAAALTWARYRLSRWRFLLWYSLGLALVAVGALGLILQPTPGSWLGWVARGAQYLGGAYMLVGTVLTMRESGGWKFSLAERLIRSEEAQREQAELLRTINDSTSELIYMKDCQGKLTYANAATLRVLGCSHLEPETPDSALFRVPAEFMAVADNDRRVMQEDRVIEVEEMFTGADGVRRHFLSTKSPHRDPAGRIVGVIGVSRDITERVVAMESLREADRRKDEFLATLAHELRGPLAPLRNTLEILKRSEGNRDLLERARDTIDRQSGQLVRLVDDLLEVSRITRNRIELRRERVDLASIIHQSVEASRPLAELAGVAMNISLPPQPIALQADPARLAQVFSNLLNNACKYTEAGGEVLITAEAQEGFAVVSVRDTGLGIPSDQLSRVFDMFVQIDRTLERSQGGLGIGLTLVKRLVEMHAGTVEAQSDGPGKGSAFTVRLPLSIDETVPSESKATSKATSPPRRILVVDDNVDSATSLALLLELSGNETQVAHDGFEAVEAARRFQPDLVLLDIGLPRLNGFDACRRIREQAWGQDMVIVALTGWGQEDDRRKSKDAGFDHHMVKPLDLDALTKLPRTRSMAAGQNTRG